MDGQGDRQPKSRRCHVTACHGALPVDWVMETDADPSNEYFFVTWTPESSLAVAGSSKRAPVSHPQPARVTRRNPGI